MLCKHCGRNKACRPRGLCFPCFYTPGLRERYPLLGDPKHIHLGLVGDEMDSVLPRSIPPLPTLAPPGTEEKIRVLRDRVKMGLSLHHPADARYEDDDRTLAAIRQIRTAASSQVRTENAILPAWPSFSGTSSPPS